MVSEWPLVVNERKCMDRIRDTSLPVSVLAQSSPVHLKLEIRFYSGSDNWLFNN